MGGNLAFFKAWGRATCEPDFKRLCENSGCFFHCLRTHWDALGEEAVSNDCKVAVKELKDSLGVEFVAGKHSEIAPTAVTSSSSSSSSAIESFRCSTSQETQLTSDLRSSDTKTVSTAMDSLWDCWFRSEGDNAFDELRIGNSLMNMGPKEYSAAAAVFRALISRFPNWVEAKNRLATLLWLEGQYEQSLTLCDQILHSNPSHFGALSGCSMVAKRLGKMKEAHALTTSLRQVCPSCAGAAVEDHVFTPSPTAAEAEAEAVIIVATTTSYLRGNTMSVPVHQTKQVSEAARTLAHSVAREMNADAPTHGHTGGHRGHGVTNTVLVKALLQLGTALGVVGAVLLLCSYSFTVTFNNDHEMTGVDDSAVGSSMPSWIVERWTREDGWILSNSRAVTPAVFVDTTAEPLLNCGQADYGSPGTKTVEL